LGLACGKASQDGPAAGAHEAGGNAGGNGSVAGGSTAGGGSPGGLGEGGSFDEFSHVDLSGVPIYTRVQRLTNTQWENAVTDILRLKKAPGLAADFAAPIANATTFDNNEQVLFVDQRRFTDFESGAEAVAALATGSPEALDALYTGDDAAGFVRAFGRRAFRRPLTSNEETKYQDIFALGERLYGSGFANGAALVIRAMLESPYFLYRTELGAAGDPLSAYELASKLSFWLLGTTPSDALLDAAAAGSFADDDALEATAREILEDARATVVMRDFHGQLLRVSSLQDIKQFDLAEYDPAIIPELVLASNAFFDRVFGQNHGLLELLTSNQAYVGSRLAPLYGLAAPTAALELRDIGPARAGYFMQVPFLMRWSNIVGPDPIQRGLRMEAAVLCGPARPPPPEIPPLVPIATGQTNRERITSFNTSCGGNCHRFFDPLGFAFENFDGLGRQRELDNGVPVDTTGSYPLAEGNVSFADGPELMKVLAGSTQVHTCYSKQVTSYALGRDLVESDRPVLESLAKVSRSQSLKEVIIALVRDPEFRTRKSGQP